MARRSRPVVLIVDDELDVLLPLADFLQFMLPGAKIFPTGSPSEALDFAHDQPVDLVICDYRMPEMNGDRLLRLLQDTQGKPACMLMTAYPNPGLAYRTMNEGPAVALFTKPFDARLMAEKALEVLQQRNARAAP